MMTTQRTTSRTSTPTAAPVSLCFFGAGFISLLIGLALLLVDPGVLFGDPYRAAVLAVSHLILPGFVGSLVFGSGYMLVPVMSATALWSRKMAWAHLILHVIGTAWMVVAFSSLNFVQVGKGGTLVFIGMMAFVLNLAVTASKYNRWDPALVSFVSALFWLCVTSGLALLMLINKFTPVFASDPQWLMGIHAHMGLIGFFWLLLLGASLKLFTMFMVSSASAGIGSWLGLGLVNLALLLMIPAENFGGSDMRWWIAMILLCGSSLYLLDLVRILARSRQRMDAGMLTAAAGMLIGFALMGWYLAGMPVMADAADFTVREKTRIYFTLATFGPLMLAIFGMATRIIPFLAWQVRYAPFAGETGIPTARDLVNERGKAAMAVCLLLGWFYIAAAQWAGFPAGLQLGLLCMAIGFGWFAYVLMPALRAIVFPHQPAVAAGGAAAPACSRINRPNALPH